MEKISIIVPIYNVEKYLPDCIECAVCQSYPNKEVILVDDGSTDKSGEIAESYAKEFPEIKVYHTENQGVSKARNFGIEKATGEYIIFVDADDILLMDSLSNLHSIIKDYNVDLVQGKTVRTDIREEKYLKLGKVKVFTATDALKNLFYQKTITSSVNGKLFVKSIIDKLRFKENTRFEDYDFMVHVLLECNKVAYLNTPVYYYVNNPNSFTNTWNEHSADVLTVMDEIEDYMMDNHEDLLLPAGARRLSALFNIFCRATVNKEPDLADKCWRIIKIYRFENLINPHVRLKNKMGILLSYGGKKFFKRLARVFY